ncbi:MAG: DegT/DnrJ/EryC1/StrS family aminotransferase [Rhodothermales bacterium]|nr:DegT/DnrJ/EryC1/StrS family aminotransferase [Rhodothermales bacterium]
MIPLSLPDLSERETRYVLQALDTRRLALGPFVTSFEEKMAALCGVSHAVAVNSGTAALHLIVRALGLGAGDEVITTPYSFVASANCLLFEHVTPRFVDVDPETYTLDVRRIEAALTPATRAILAVDVFGQPADWPSLEILAKRHGLMLIDDACEAPGASVQGRPVGAWGRAAAFGFYPNKPITTGEGGCITTDDPEIAALCRSMANQGRRTPAIMEHVRLGYNYRLDELSAAIGCAQLERSEDLFRRRRQVAAWYDEALAGLAHHFRTPSEQTGSVRSWFVYVIELRPESPAGLRDRVMERLRAAGIGSAPYFPTIHLQPYYRERFGYREGDFPVAESISARTLALPFYSTLTEDEVARVAEALAGAFSAEEKNGNESLHGVPN